MQWSLVAAFIPIVNILWCDASAMDWDCHIKNIISKCGYESSCVYNFLKTCYNSPTTPNESSLTDDIVSQMKNITKTLTVVQTLLQEAKSELENASNFQSEIKTLLQEIKSEREISVSEIKALRHDIKSEGENSSSVVKALLQEMKSERENSVSEIKTLLQKVKTEQQNEKTKSAIFEALVNDQLKIKNCADLRVLLGKEFSGGVQTVYPYLPNPRAAVVFCDQVTDGGGWTVIQSRSPLPIRENFQRNWTEYVEGFGDPKGELWLGLDNIHALTKSSKMQLRIDLEDAEGQRRWAHYATFHMGDTASEYVLRIGGYSGDAGNAMTYPSDKDFNLNGMKFSTHDNDNDLWESNCAEKYKGGWWFNFCSAAHLNGLPIVGNAPYNKGITWVPFRINTQSMKKATMRIRPVCLGF